MRIHSIKHLVHLYSVFFVRKILSFGVLKNPIIRVLMLISFVVLLTFISFSVFVFFSETLQTQEVVLFLLNTYSSTIVLWTIVVTIFLKLVFSKVDGFLRMTTNFPISSKERNFSVFIYETLISFIVIFLISFSVVLSMILVHQFAFIDVLIVNLLYVSTLSYLMLQVISKLVSFACVSFRIPKLFHIINLSVLVFVFAVFFNESQLLVTGLANDLLQETNETKSILLFLQQFHQDHGLMFTTLVYLSSVIGLIALIIMIPDQSYMASTKHVRLLGGFKTISIIKAYVISAIRNINTLNTVVFVYLAAIILMVFDLSDYILYTIIMIAFNSIYSFTQSQNLRHIMYRFNYKAWKDYLYLLASQLFIIYLISIPLLILGFFVIESYLQFIIPYIVVTFGALIFVMAGILFPPYHDNPFSVVTSVAVVTIPIFIIGISLTFLNLNLLWNVAIMILFYFVIIHFSIQGLTHLKRGVRNEKFG
ncbi:hypothetical protein [Lentibacillus saliphilus]|uniref:hypothetical protein n=1 Tax=Lentibacillus saliphilus TaxID=2737028 RepID=UPI001C3106BB|nr:hypothetical protein [Lentibacillus saliphilus]